MGSGIRRINLFGGPSQSSVEEDPKLFIFEFFSIIISVILIGIINIYIRNQFSYLDTINISKLNEIFIVGGFAPERVESLQYISSILIYPILVSLLIYYFMNNFSSNKIIKQTPFLYKVISYISLLLIGLLLYLDLSSNTDFYSNIGYNYLLEHPIRLLFLTSALIVLVLTHNHLPSLSKYPIDKISTFINKLLFFIVSFFIILLSIKNIFSIYNVDNSWTYNNHFNALFYSMTQLFFGKALFVDFPNQYGLYPYILEPIFRLVGLTVLNFTLIMSILLAFAFFSLYIFTIKIVDNKILASLGFSGILFYNYLFLYLRNGYDPYFQYFPLRILFPSLIILTVYFYFKNKNAKFYYLSLFLAILSIFWNFEIGLVVFLTWLIALAYQEILENPIKPALIRILKHIAISISFLSITIIIFIIYIYLRFGSYPLFSNLIEYQKIFYSSGFAMIPMSLIHPWNIVILIYFIGIAHSAKYLIMRNNSIRTKMIFFLTILGLGVFVYYQGRSHDQVLSVVWYPALLLLIICIDDLYNKISHAINGSKNISFMHMAVFIGIIFFFIFADLSLLSNCRDVGERINLRFESLLRAEPTEITNNSDFIKNHTIPKEEVIIVSGNSGVYHLQSETLSPFKGPGFGELFLRKDFDNLLNMVSDNESRYKIFLDTNFYSSHPEYMTQLICVILRKYNCINMSKTGKVILCEKINKSIDHKGKFLLSFSNQSILHCRYDNSSFSYVSWDSRLLDLPGRNVLDPIYPSENFTLEILVLPHNEQVAFAAILGNHPGNGTEGFVIQRNYMNQNEYTFGFGNGKEWLPSMKFNLTKNKLNNLLINVRKNQTHIYVDGKLIGSVNTIESIKNSDMPLYIGNWIGGDRPFNGFIEEIKIINDD